MSNEQAPKYKLVIVSNDPTNHYKTEWKMVRIADNKPVAAFVSTPNVAQLHLIKANAK